MRLPPSISRIEVFAGSIRRKFERRVTAAISAIDPASSTPVGPAPTSTKVICLARFIRVVRLLRRLVGAENFCPDCLSIPEGLEPGGMLGELVVAEIAWPHPSGDHQIIERYFFIQGPGTKFRTSGNSDPRR